MKKLMNVKGIKTISKNDQKMVNGGRVQASADFACYCNGTYVGEMGSIADCWNACC